MKRELIFYIGVESFSSSPFRRTIHCVHCLRDECGKVKSGEREELLEFISKILRPYEYGQVLGQEQI